MSLVEQFIQFMKHTLAVKMVALPREYSHRHSNLSCEVAIHKRANVYLKTLQQIFGKSELSAENSQRIFGRSELLRANYHLKNHAD